MYSRGWLALAGVILFVLILYGEAQAAAYPPIQNVVVEQCYDGDTCTVTLPDTHPVFGLHLPVRFAGIDTPEMKGRCARERELAIKARDVVRYILSRATVIELRDPRRDKYFRLLARVIADDQDLAQVLLDRGLAVPYWGGRKEGWC